ncbi:hypothetical protein KEM54_006343 [Ascosphaera aggregata]|nr:hypothetical protein KEM54_006343 [Ascosphaera aggregata]
MGGGMKPKRSIVQLLLIAAETPVFGLYTSFKFAGRKHDRRVVNVLLQSLSSYRKDGRIRLNKFGKNGARPVPIARTDNDEINASWPDQRQAPPEQRSSSDIKGKIREEGRKKSDNPPVCRFMKTQTVSSSSGSGDSVLSCLVGRDEVNLAAHKHAMAIAPGVQLQSALHPVPPLSQPHPQPEIKVEAKPVPQSALADPREHELSQIRCRYKPTSERTDVRGTILEFDFVSSDPDIQKRKNVGPLKCVLRVPLSYPTSDSTKPSIMVTNKELSAGLKRLTRLKFDAIVGGQVRVTLLRALSLFDRALPEMFALPKSLPTCQFLSAKQKQPANVTKSSGKAIEKVTQSPEEEELRQQSRSQEIRQLESRFQKDKDYNASKDLQTFIVPITPANRGALPPRLKEVGKLRLHVPLMYPLEPCTISLPGIPDDDEAAMNLKGAFEEHVRSNKGVSLVSHVNFLGVKMHVLAKRKKKLEKTQKDEEKKQKAQGGMEKSSISASLTAVDEKQAAPVITSSGDTIHPSTSVDISDNKAHIHFIPRPPEWNAGNRSSCSDSDSPVNGEDFSSDENDSDEYDAEEDGPQIPTPVNLPPTGRHVALSFPEMSMHNIELLYIRSLALVIKCERCKETAELRSLVVRNNDNQHPARPPKMSSSCKKCGIVMSVEYRHELMHQGSNRAGYLLMQSCTAIDILPSQFTPTCSECSTTSPDGFSCVRGGNFIAFCKKCHKKMNCHLPDVKFLLVSAGSGTVQLKVKRPRKEVLGICAGQELPRRGRCSHYAKSYRWFRFSCCQRVFPCDKCHDAALEHPNEHANRMICGYCSREQNYRPDNCAICHAVLTGRTGTGFWEGGKGTRDKVRMSRKDPRKYKRRGDIPPGGKK